MFSPDDVSNYDHITINLQLSPENVAYVHAALLLTLETPSPMNHLSILFYTLGLMAKPGKGTGEVSGVNFSKLHSEDGCTFVIRVRSGNARS